MTDEDKTPPPKNTLHPVYSVNNTQNKVRTLDGVKVSYASWVNLFTLHARGYKVFNHIDSTKPPDKTDPTFDAWVEIDSHVLQWIYGTMSDDLLSRVLEPDSTAHGAWTRVKNIFLNNKGARAAALEHEFNNLKLGAMPSLDAYCQRLRILARQLKDVDSEVSDQRLVLALVCGLPSEYDTVASYINQTLPAFETARSMLELEQHRKSSREDTDTALAASTAPSSAETTSWSASAPATPAFEPRYGNKNNKRNYKGGHNAGSRQYHNNNNAPAQTSAPAPTLPPWSTPPTWVAFWAPPPCHYPTCPGWASPWPTWPHAAPPRPSSSTRGPCYPLSHVRSYGQAHLTHDEPHQPTDLGAAFHAMSLTPSSGGSWFMDTGASSHLTSDEGMLRSPFNSSTIKSIYVGNGSSIPIRGSGTSQIHTPDRDLHLHRVLYAPQIIKNLISVRQFTKDNNVSVEFDPCGFSVKDLVNGKTILRSNGDGELYPVSSKSSPSLSNSASHSLLTFAPECGIIVSVIPVLLSSNFLGLAI
ncbi:hypothetical protein vseg_001795 [Gypsophila vaccaria]